jgi:anti-sigma factor RsiW
VKCPVVIDRLSAFIDGELPGVDRRAVEWHLDGCPDCASVHQRLAAAWALVADAPRVAPRVDLWPRIEARLAGGRRRPAWLGRLAWNPLPALALVAGLLLGLQLGEALVRDRGSAPSAEASRLDVHFLGDVFPGSLAEVVLDVASPPAGAVTR